jgi:FkbM family methyltransferase
MMLVKRQIKSAIKAMLPHSVRRALVVRRFNRRPWRGEPEVLELRRFVRPTDIAIDVGGNIGVYSYALSRLARRVVTFEPNPDLALHLRSLRLKNVEVREIALSAAPGQAVLSMPDRPNGHGYGSLKPDFTTGEKLKSFTVAMDRLDNVDLGAVAFIKIDVEGFEEDVLAGASATLALHKPAVLVEIVERHNPGAFDRIGALFRGLGYSGHFFDRGTWHGLDDFDLATQQDPARLEELGRRPRSELGYVNNFLFLPPGRTMDVN